MTASRRTRGSILAAAVALGLTVPAAAQATATVTVTGDDGAAVNTATNPTIRNMRTEVVTTNAPATGRYTVTIAGPGGVPAGTNANTACRGKASASTGFPDYVGNGAYTVTVQSFADNNASCSGAPAQSEVFTFTVNAGTAITPPAAPFLYRRANSFSTSPLDVPVALNPGASSHEVRYLRNGVPGPDGGLPDTAQKAFPGANGLASLRFDAPGVYTVVARASRFGSGGESFTAWSAPVRVLVVAPSDFRGSIQFVDRRGPSYSVRAQFFEKSARGTVRVSISPGLKSTRFRTLGKSRISRTGTVTARFKLRKPGTYRLRFSYKGTSLIVGGTNTVAITIRRSFF